MVKTKETRNLAEMRKEAGYSPDEVAEILGVRRDFFEKAEDGSHRFRIDWVPIIADLYSEEVEDVVQAALNTYYHGFYDPPLPSRRR